MCFFHKSTSMTSERNTFSSIQEELPEREREYLQHLWHALSEEDREDYILPPDSAAVNTRLSAEDLVSGPPILSMPSRL